MLLPLKIISIEIARKMQIAIITMTGELAFSYIVLARSIF